MRINSQSYKSINQSIIN